MCVWVRGGLFAFSVCAVCLCSGLVVCFVLFLGCVCIRGWLVVFSSCAVCLGLFFVRGACLGSGLVADFGRRLFYVVGCVWARG